MRKERGKKEGKCFITFQIMTLPEREGDARIFFLFFLFFIAFPLYCDLPHHSRLGEGLAGGEEGQSFSSFDSELHREFESDERIRNLDAI